MIKVLFFLMTLLFVSQIRAQQTCSLYTLSGTINGGIDKIILCPPGAIEDTGYYPYKNRLETKVVNGNFTFTDSINYPTPFILIVRKTGTTYNSGMFFIDPCSQTIACNIDSLKKTPEISNKTMREWKGIYTKAFKNINYEINKQRGTEDSIRKIYSNKIPLAQSTDLLNKKDSLNNEWNSLLLHYTKEHPNSYVSLWMLIYVLSNGYKSVYDSIYSQFSDSIKNTPTGLTLYKRLHSARTIAIGTLFPQLYLYTIDDSFVKLPKFNKNNSYTLVDFWFSSCMPCKRQFPLLKKLYDNYKKSGFQIIGISVDQNEHINDLKKIIKEQDLNWQQYRDKDYKNANELSIEGYPTNFLLDKNGIIIKRNIKLEELEQMLRESQQ